jgi:poly-gamma-glutamate synthesis protein (capsule biosynthesis protein)
MAVAKITFLGDALCDPPMLAGYETAGGYDFRPVFAPVRDFLAASDYVVANLETPLSETGGDLTHERWRFNSPRAYAEALQWAGVDFVTTANNHCLDRGTVGLGATIGVLDAIGLPHTGTFATREAAACPAIAEIAGFRLGLLSYTYGTNAFANHEYLTPEESFMVNLFQEQELSEPLVRAWFADRHSPEGRAYEEMERRRWPENLTLPIYERIAPHDVQRARFADDVARLRAAGPDFVALGMHTGGQYNPAATVWTKELAAFALSCGVNMVVGTHEHVVHGGDSSRFGEGQVVAYCLGDLASSTGLWADIPDLDHPPATVTYSIAWHMSLERDKDGLPRLAGTSFSVLVRRKGPRHGRVVVHPAAELWRSLPAGEEKDSLAAGIRAAASIFSGRPFDDEPVVDEYPLCGIINRA